MSKIRVLQMIGSLDVGGSQIMIMNIYRNINRKLVQFDFVIDRDEESFFKEEILRLGGKIYKLPKFNGKNFFDVTKAWDNFLNKHKEYKIIHSHVRSYASIYLPIAKNHGLKTIIHSHSTSNGSGFASAVKKVMQFPLRYIADYFFACGKDAGQWLFGRNTKFKILNNAIDTNVYKFDMAKRLEIRKSLGISDDTFVVGNVGRFMEVKNHSFLIDIFAELSKHKKAKMLLVGDGELRSEIEDKIKRLNLTDKVILTGFVDNVQDYLQAMDVFVFPSVYEGLGIVAVEAQATGLPVVCSDVVPKESKITSIIKYIPLDKPVSFWEKCILKCTDGYERKDTTDKIKKAGYDIHQTAQWLENFYINKHNSTE